MKKLTIYVLAFPQGTHTKIAAGTECASKREAEILLGDRVANGHAFPGEFVVKVPVAILRANRLAFSEVCRNILRNL